LPKSFIVLLSIHEGKPYLLFYAEAEKKSFCVGKGVCKKSWLVCFPRKKDFPTIENNLY
jgi:hypothetical protein